MNKELSKKKSIFDEKSPIKYPFIHNFVDAMSQINAHEHVTNQMDLKTLLVFFQIYIISCQKLNTMKIPVTNENLYRMMECEFDLWRLDSRNYMENNINYKNLTNPIKQLE